MIFKKPEKNRLDEVLTLGAYFKYWIYEGGTKHRNPDCDDFSIAILNLKNQQEKAITYFLYRLEKVLGDGFVVCYVPSHDPKNTQSGVRILATELAKTNPSIIDGTDCLVRTQEIAKLSGGGNRSINVHLNSLEVRNRNLIRNRDILLLDDVTTTGNSLLACKQLLLEAGANNVQCLAMGRTAA